VIGGLVVKAIRETWRLTALFAIGLAMVLALLTHILPPLQKGLDGLLAALPIVRTLLAVLLGSSADEPITARMMQTVVWVHPVVLALIWGYETALCTRYPAGEIDRGTIDIVFGLPVSRRGVFIAETIVWLLGGVVVFACGAAGHAWVASRRPADVATLEIGDSLKILGNLFAVFVAVGGVAQCVAAWCDRRSTAMLIIFAIVLASFLLHFLAPFWEPARTVVGLSVLHYYQPARILERGLSVRDLAVLIGVGAAASFAACETVARRDFRAV